MADVQVAEGINPDKLDSYLAHLSEDQSEQSEAQIRADLARNLVTVARTREVANDVRRQQLIVAVARARLTFLAAVVVLVLAAIAVMVNA
jgi:hypothetical protein